MKEEHLNALIEASRDIAADGSLLEAAQHDAWRLNEIELTIEDLEKQIVALREEREELRTRRLPSLMTEASAPVVSIGNVVVKLRSTVQGQLPSVAEGRKMDMAQREENQAKRAWIFQWLQAHGHGGVIRRVLSTDLPRGDEAVMHKAVDALRALKLHADVKEDVHFQTYQRICRELCADADAIASLPLQQLCIFVGLVAEVVR